MLRKVLRVLLIVSVLSLGSSALAVWAQSPQADAGSLGAPPPKSDLDSDGQMDLVVFRPSYGVWFGSLSTTAYADYLGKAWGADGDKPLSGDIDGDGKMDLVIYRPSVGVWFALLSTTGYDYTSPFVQSWGGAAEDIPLLGDQDGDGEADLVIYRPGVGAWFILLSGSNYTTSFVRGWGAPGDTPISGDVDGDGQMDLIVLRPSSEVPGPSPEKGVGEGLQSSDARLSNGQVKALCVSQWMALTSSTDYDPSSPLVQAWGEPDDEPLSGDLDGDGKTDLIVYRPSNGVWFALLSGTSFTTTFGQAWGAPGDTPIGGGDLDGDGKMDLIVYRPSVGVWFGVLSSTGYDTSAPFIKGWGAPGDQPVQ